jgi:hypothetical protein
MASGPSQHQDRDVVLGRLSRGQIGRSAVSSRALLSRIQRELLSTGGVAAVAPAYAESFRKYLSF